MSKLSLFKTPRHGDFRAIQKERLLTKKMYCKLCKPAVVISYSTNASNLTYHLWKRHLEEYKKVTEVKDREHRVPGLQQATLQEAIASAVPYSKDSK